MLAVHPVRVASTRLRAMQYTKAAAARGVQIGLWSFFRDDDLPRWFGSSQLGRMAVLARGMLRLGGALLAIRRADVVLVQREALPLGPALLERYAASRAPVVWDVDDAIWQDFGSPTAGRVPQWLRATGGKYAWLCRHATEVWVGSDVLAEWVRRHRADVRVVPTVVPVPAERPSQAMTRTVSWIGSHSTGPFLEAVLPAVAAVSPPAQVHVVGAAPRTPPGLDVTVHDWSPATEASVLAVTAVGLYPIDRAHPLAEGKCGLKAIMYMANGIPTVLTPTSTNAAVVRDAIEGLHADDPAAWTAAVQRLLDDAELRNRLGTAAHSRALAEYSLQAWAPRVADSLARLGGVA